MKHRKHWRAACAAALITAVLAGACPAQADETVWLSSLDLTRATQGSGQPSADKSVGGNPLTLSGQVYAHGFGTQAPGLLVVHLGGGAKRFTASVGVDDEAGVGLGNVEFLVLGDNHQTLWRSGPLHQGLPPKPVDVDLTGVQQLTLRVTAGRGAARANHADWADAQFLVTGARPMTVASAQTDTPPMIWTGWTGPGPEAPQINPPLVVGIPPGLPLLWTVPVSGPRPLTFSAKGLPPGVTLNATTGRLTGKVTKPGDYPITVQVQNSTGRDSKTIHLRVGPALALTPPMGWNSYDAFGDDVTEAEFLANARYVAHTMQPYGWDTVVVDFRWYDPGTASNPNHPPQRAGVALTMDANGRLLPSPTKFPSATDGAGFKALADRVHAMGLKFGIHIMRGIPRNAVKADLPILGTNFKATDAADTSDTCPWCPDMYGVRGDTPAGQAYYDSLFQLYASWGVDFVKMDDTSRPYHTSEIEAVHSAIGKCGRAIVYSLSPGATPLEQAAHVETHANMWREADDFWDSWTPLNAEFTLGAHWQPFAAPGHWPDGDMLPLGHLSVGNRSVGRDRRTKFTGNEQVTLLSLWCLLPSPLMLGANAVDNDDFAQWLLTNPEVLAVNQDALGASGMRVSSVEDRLDVWSKKLADGSLAVGLFNRGDFDGDQITARWQDLGLTGRWAVRDLWQRKDLGTFDSQFSARPPPRRPPAPPPPGGAVRGSPLTPEPLHPTNSGGTGEKEIGGEAALLFPSGSPQKPPHGYNLHMSVQDIQAAIAQLPKGEFDSLLAWIDEYRADAWDRQIAQDVEAGRFDALRQRVREQRQAGLYPTA